MGYEYSILENIKTYVTYVNIDVENAVLRGKIYKSSLIPPKNQTRN